MSIHLPPRRKSVRSEILRGPKREFPKHRKYVRSHACCVPGCQEGPIEFAHYRTAQNAGTGIKPHDSFAISLCSIHHRQQHQIGVVSFEQMYGISIRALAREFVRTSPDIEMRQSLALVGPEDRP